MPYGFRPPWELKVDKNVPVCFLFVYIVFHSIRDQPNAGNIREVAVLLLRTDQIWIRGDLLFYLLFIG